VQVTKFLQQIVIRVQDKPFSLEVLVEEVHPLDGGSGFQQKWRVVHLMVLELSGCEKDVVKISFLVHLGQDGPKAPWSVCQSRGSIGD
jgi:hypothetical protein